MTQPVGGEGTMGQRAIELDLFQRPGIGLFYLFFVFLPLMFPPQVSARAILLSVLAAGLFLPVYYASFRRDSGWWPIAVSAVLGYALIPFNPGGNTFIIYAMAMAAHRLPPRAAIGMSAGMLLVMGIEFLWLTREPLVAFGFIAVVAVIGTMVVAGTLYSRMQQRRMAELKLSHDEVRRLAALAERERIARDLHDLLGHTLSVVVLKSELAGKLIERRPEAARAQIAEVEQVARQALREVREAVTGFRSGDLNAELAAARLVLAGADIELEHAIVDTPIQPPQEAALALGLREAITNVLRHAGASRVQVRLTVDGDAICLHISDNGRGGEHVHGNGLRGMHERLAALGGGLEIAHGHARGTHLRLKLPRDAALSAGSAA